MALDFDPSSILSGADQGWTLNSSGSGVGGLGDSLNLGGSFGGFDSPLGSSLNGNLVGGSPVDSTGSSLWTSIANGLGALNTAANIGLGVYKNVSNPTQQQVGQPEMTADGRLVANIQGKPTVLTTDTSSRNILLLGGLLLAGVVVVAILHKG